MVTQPLVEGAAPCVEHFRLEAGAEGYNTSWAPAPIFTMLSSFSSFSMRDRATVAEAWMQMGSSPGHGATVQPGHQPCHGPFAHGLQPTFSPAENTPAPYLIRRITVTIRIATPRWPCPTALPQPSAQSPALCSPPLLTLTHAHTCQCPGVRSPRPGSPPPPWRACRRPQWRPGSPAARCPS